MELNLKRNRKVLLIEPPYKVKYPPLGLMKISTYHKRLGDEVAFFKGNNTELRDREWDIIYITSLFTFQWRGTIQTIKFYQRNKTNRDIKVGGILASLLPEELENETGIKPHKGLLPRVDRLPPDYSLSNDYTANNASFGFMTRGCVNRCKFCAVPTLEPAYEHFIPLKPQLSVEKRDLILLDNNILASEEFAKIVKEIEKAGFAKTGAANSKRRYVDFNQGVDITLLDEDKMVLLSRLAVKPLRLAFDSINLKRLYIEKVRLAHKHGVTHLSNFILFNFNDTPEEFYERLRINIELNEELGLSIFSFPMKFVPLDAKDRSYVDPAHWNKTQLRGIQCILHATHGVVGPRKPFFEKAFGRNAEEFKYIIERPEEEIFYRSKMQPFR